MIEIVVRVEGGVCQEVRCSEVNARVTLIDIDNLKAEGKSENQRNRIEWDARKLARYPVF